MSRFSLIAAAALMAFVVSAAHGDIVSLDVAADGDGAITCVANWNDPVLTIAGDHLEFAPGHVLSMPDAFTTDTAEDPTIRINNVMQNDTTHSWTAYNVKLGIRAKNPDIALSGLSLSAGVNAPIGWTATIVQPLTLTATYLDADGRVMDRYYIAEIDYSGTPSVAPGGEVDLTAIVTFQGATSYIFWQELTPVPEPATMGLLVLGGLAMIRRRR